MVEWLLCALEAQTSTAGKHITGCGPQCRVALDPLSVLEETCAPDSAGRAQAGLCTVPLTYRQSLPQVCGQLQGYSSGSCRAPAAACGLELRAQHRCL